MDRGETLKLLKELRTGLSIFEQQLDKFINSKKSQKTKEGHSLD